MIKVVESNYGSEKQYHMIRLDDSGKETHRAPAPAWAFQMYEESQRELAEALAAAETSNNKE